MKKEGNGVIYYLIYREKESELFLKYNKNAKNLQQNNSVESLL